MTNDAGDVLRRYLEAGDRGDLAQMAAFLDDGVICHSPGGTRLEGVAAVGRSWTAAHEGLRELRHAIEEVLAVGNTAVARVIVTGVHAGNFLGLAATGAPLCVYLALFAHVHEGRIREMWEIVDTGEALRQLGALEGQPLAPGA